MRRTLALTAVLVFAAAPGLAQDPGDDPVLCGMSSPAACQGLRAQFVGDWRVAHLSGYVLAGRIVIPMQPSPDTEIMSVWLLGEDLLLDHPEMTEPMTITLADEGVCSGWGQNDILRIFAMTFHNVEHSVFADAEFTTTLSGRTALWVTAHPRRKASSRWTRDLQCTKNQTGPPDGGTPRGVSGP